MHEYIVRSELESTIEKVCKMVTDASNPDFPKYAYVKKTYEAVKVYDWSKSYFYEKRKSYDAYEKSWTDCRDNDADLDEMDEEPVLKKLPSEYEEIYDELLELYSAEELERYRKQYGDQILYQIYIDEYGPFYAEQDRKVI